MGQLIKFPKQKRPSEKPSIMLRKVPRTEEDCKRAVVEALLREVVHAAKEQQDKGRPFLDLVCDGNVGLINAVEEFMPQARQMIRDEIAKNLPKEVVQ